MSRIFITGSTDGLGLAAARTLMDEGHEVVLHARSSRRTAALADIAARSAGIVIGDLSSAVETRSIAKQVNRIGRMDAVIHNAGIYNESTRGKTPRMGHCAISIGSSAAGMRASRIPKVNFISRARDGGRAAMEGCARPCRRSRLGPDENGRPGRARRSDPGTSHADLACREQRCRCERKWRLLASPQTTAAGGGSARCRFPGSTHRPAHGSHGPIVVLIVRPHPFRNRHRHRNVT